MSIMEPASRRTGTPIVSFDSVEAKAKFRRESFFIDHALAEHPSFGLDALSDLAERLPQDVIEHNLGSVNPLEPGGKVPKLDLPPAEIVRGIETNGCWIVLPIVLVEGKLGGMPGYQDVFDAVMDDIAPMVPGGRDAMSGFHSVIFVAARESVTPCHLDGEIGFLLHVRGEKRLSIGRYADADRQRAELEAYHRNEHRNTGVLPIDVRDFDLAPGQGVHVPPLTPHWVSSGAEVTISLSVGFQTPENLRRAAVYRVNARLRPLGLKPVDYGQSHSRDRAKAAAFSGFSRMTRRVRRPVA